MCFGPVSSFSTSAALTAIGAATLRNVRSKKMLLFASMPALFAVQAAIEGALWLILMGKGPQYWREGMALAFLFFAYVVWPVLVPASVYVLEPDEKKRKVLRLLWAAGIGTAAYLVFLVATHPLDTYVAGHSIRYETTRRPELLLVAYLAATVAPYFVSSFREFRFFGLLNLVFCIVAYYFYTDAFDSVWCFFAAVSSGAIYMLVRRIRQEPSGPVPLPA